MTNLYERDTTGSFRGLWRGVIATDASSKDDTVEVTIPSFDPNLRFGPCHWMDRGGSLPERGNICKIMFDDRQQAFIVWWQPFDPNEGGLGGEGLIVYEQAGQPGEPISIGTLWIDTDEPPPKFTSPIVSALPPAPFDGQEIYYQNVAMATDGVVWHFRYREGSTSAYKWEKIGGSKLYAQSTVPQNVPTTTPTVVPPSLTLPLAGEYNFAWGARIYVQNPAGQNAILALYINNVQQTPYLDHYQGTAGVNVTLHATNPLQTMKKVVTAATQVADLRMWAGSGTATSDNRWIEADPVRV